MSSAGCGFVGTGVETGVEELRFVLNKRVEDAGYFDVVSWCRKLGVTTRAYAMFGHPGETTADMQQTIEFIKKLKPDHALFRLTDVIPGTALHSRALKEGIVDENSWREYMLGNAPYPIFKPENLDETILYDICTKAFKEFYFRKAHIFQRMRKIKSAKDIEELTKLSILYLFNKTGVMKI